MGAILPPLSALALALGLSLGACVPREQAAGVAMAPARLVSETARDSARINEPSPADAHVDEMFVAADGTRLPIQRWLPTGRPKAVFLALHGMNDYANAFALPGEWWAERGIATYAYDQRGFGRTPNPGMWAGTATLDGDFDALVKLLRGRYPKVPLFVLGESMGGAVAMTALAAPNPPKVDGIILAAPAVWGRATMDFGKRMALWLAAHTVPWLEVSGRGLDIVPSDNREMLIALSRDPLVIKETRIDAISGLVDLMDAALADAPHLGSTPLLILYGERDQIIPPDPTHEMIESLPRGGALTVALYPKGYHMLLRDLEAERVWNDVLHWVEDPKAPLPSGADQAGAQAFFQPRK
jgi:acylglycerol lipase